MLHEVTVPSVGESISEGVLAVWSVKNGAYVNKGDTLFELETDKASTEVPAPESGTVTHKAEEGADVTIGDVVAVIDTEGKGAAKSAEDSKTKDDAAPAKADAAKESESDSVDAGEQNGKRLTATSLAKKVAEELGVDLSKVKGSGQGGRITREDVEAAAKAPKGEQKKDAPAKAQAASPADGGAGAQGEVKRERMTTLRKRIAERLVEAQQTTAMLTTFNDVDMSAVMALRSQYKDAFKDKHGVGLGFMSFFTRACIEALQQFPRVNAMIDGNEIVTYKSQHVGVAVSTEKGLVVPVLRNAEKMSFAEIEAKIREYAIKARDGKIELSEMQGGTFTITNGGVFGSMLSTPILNPPQSAILGMHRIEDRPVARDGQVVIRPMMYLALSYDHRIIDGREAVGFLVRIKDCIENPSRMLLGV